MRYLKVAFTAILILSMSVSVNLLFGRDMDATQKLLDQKWYLKSINGNPIKAENIYLSFDAGKELAHFKVCNNFTGGYFIDEKEGTIKFDKMMGTLKWCADDEIQHIESTITGALTKNALTYSVIERDLILTDASGNSYTWHSENKERQLEYLSEYRWKLIQMNGVQKEYDQTMEFNFSENRIYGHSGCNNYFGNITIEANLFKPSMIAGTKRACLDQSRSEEEHTFLNILNNENLTYDIADQVLNVYHGDVIVMMLGRSEKVKK